MAASNAPQQVDLDKCVHCGLCLNACPTYRELGLEMDSPRGRVYQMVKVSTGEFPITQSYIDHIDLCLACRGCETACPSGVQYGQLVEAARAQIEEHITRPLPVRILRNLIFNHLLPSPFMLKVAGMGLHLFKVSGMQELVRSTDLLPAKLAAVEKLSPPIERPFFFDQIGKTFPAEGERRYRVAFLAGCIANVSFARLNDATVRVLQKNGCEVVIPEGQGCCGALHLHSGMKEEAAKLARINVDVIMKENFDAIITNAAGCGSTLKEYDHLLDHEPKAVEFSKKMKDISEFLASIELNTKMGPVNATVTYQDSCHLAHGQKVRVQPRKMLAAVPGLKFKEMPMSDLCCGSAGIYNVVQNEMAMQLLENKMRFANSCGAEIIATANPGCMLQLQAGVRMHGQGQRVAHVVEILDEAYRNA